MYPLHNGVVKSWIIYEGTEKFNIQRWKHAIRLFAVETTKNLMKCNAGIVG